MRAAGLQRRRLVRALVFCAGLPGLTRRANAGDRLPEQTISAQRLNALVARAFPYTESLYGLVDITLRSPRLRLLPQSNRLGTALDIVLIERLTDTRIRGGMDLDYGLRFDAGQGAVRMTDVRVNRLDIDPLQPAQQALLSRYAPPVAEQLLSDFVLYQVPDSQLALARNLGLTVGALRVEADGLHIALMPAPLG